MPTEEELMRELEEVRELIREVTEGDPTPERFAFIQQEVDERLKKLGIALEGSGMAGE